MRLQPPTIGNFAIPHQRRRPSRVHLLAIDERPVWTDPAIGLIFADMRQVMRVTRADLARRLDTTETVIEDLEAGRLRSLPAWPETQRIVCAYGVRLGIDVAALLHRIRQQTIAGDADAPTAGLPRPAHASLTLPDVALLPSQPSGHHTNAGIPPAISQRVSGGHSGARKRRGYRLTRLVLVVGLGLALSAVLYNPAALLVFAREHLAALHGEGTKALMQRIGNLISSMSGGGLRWVEIDDPQVRKADKLPNDPL